MDKRAAECSRRRLLAGAAGVAGSAMVAWPSLAAGGDEAAMGFVTKLIGKPPTLSSRVRLFMPKTFPNGYTVPLDLDIDTPMTAADHVISVRVFAPKNPLVEVATFHFVPGRSQPRVSTRVRLAQPQYVIALASMRDDALLMATAFVDVATDGCK